MPRTKGEVSGAVAEDRTRDLFITKEFSANNYEQHKHVGTNQHIDLNA